MASESSAVDVAYTEVLVRKFFNVRDWGLTDTTGIFWFQGIGSRGAFSVRNSSTGIWNYMVIGMDSAEVVHPPLKGDVPVC